MAARIRNIVQLHKAVYQSCLLSDEIPHRNDVSPQDCTRRTCIEIVIARRGVAPTWQSHPLLRPCKTPAHPSHTQKPQSLPLRLLMFSLKACRRVTSGFYSQHPLQLSGPLHESQSASLRPSQSVQSVALSS